MESITTKVCSSQPCSATCYFIADGAGHYGIDIELIVNDRIHGQLEILANRGWNITLAGEFIGQKFSDYLRKFQVSAVLGWENQFNDKARMGDLELTHKPKTLAFEESLGSSDHNKAGNPVDSSSPMMDVAQKLGLE